MRILYLTDSACVRGAEANLLDLLANLDRAQVEPFVAVPAAGRVTFQLVGGGTRFVLLPFPQPDARGFTMKHWFLAARSAASLSEYVRQNRIELIHSMTTVAHLVGGMAARKACVPAIWHARRWRPLNRLRAAMMGASTRIVAPWQCVADALGDEGIVGVKVVRVNDGVDPKSVVPHTGYTLPERAVLPKGRFVFGMVGHDSTTCGVDAFAQASARVAESHNNVSFWWVGDRSATADDRVRPRYPITSMGAREDMRDVYHAVNCVVIPSMTEFSGRIALEAACAGRPIIASNTGAHAELFAKGGAIPIPPGDIDALAAAMIRIVGNQKLRWELGATARRIIAQEYAIRLAVEQQGYLYRSLLADH